MINCHNSIQSPGGRGGRHGRGRGEKMGTMVKAAEVVVNGDQGLSRESIILGNEMIFGFDCNLR